jgi:hypothetical protein
MEPQPMLENGRDAGVAPAALEAAVLQRYGAAAKEVEVCLCLRWNTTRIY